jgi:hypothetical protein
MHKPQVAIDLSGWSPKRFPPQLVKAMATNLAGQTLFGSDFPLITPDRWMEDFATLELNDAVRSAILKENALRILGIGDDAG